MSCDVCNKNDEIGVACIPGIPCSAAYCQECLDANAHPWWAIVANTACCDGLENCADWWKKMVYDTCKHLDKTIEEFNKEVTKEMKKIE